MKYLAIGIIVIIVMVAKIFLSKNKSSKEYIYQKNKYILSIAEKNFYEILSRIFNNEKFTICPKVRIADILQPSKKLDKKEKWGAFQRISSKHFDFVICTKKEMKIICAIELNDSSHQRKDRKERDDFIRKACKNAELTLIEIKAKREYNIKEIKETITSEINKNIP